MKLYTIVEAVKSFEGVFAVDNSKDDMPMLGFYCSIYQYDVTVHDSGPRHAMTSDLKEVGCLLVTDEEGIEV